MQKDYIVTFNLKVNKFLERNYAKMEWMLF